VVDVGEERIEYPNRLAVVPEMRKRQRRPLETNETNPCRQAVAGERVDASELAQGALRPFLKGHAVWPGRAYLRRWLG
jgi:hypothetical protein